LTNKGSLGSLTSMPVPTAFRIMDATQGKLRCNEEGCGYEINFKKYSRCRYPDLTIDRSKMKEFDEMMKARRGKSREEKKKEFDEMVRERRGENSEAKSATNSVLGKSKMEQLLPRQPLETDDA